MKVFQSFRLDSANQCLWRGEHRVLLTPKAFDVLRYLVEHPGRLVTQDELLEALWPETYVNPELIKKYILGIRKVLGDQHDNPVYIETLPKRGYQFIAPVTDHVPEDAQGLSSEVPSKMVGRVGPLNELRAGFKRILHDQRQIVFLAGEPGIGKTTLVDSFHRYVSAQANVRTARGQCVEGFGGKEPYYPMLDGLGHLTRGANAGPIVQALAQRAPTWLIQFPSLIKPEQREALQREILGATRERMVREICETLEFLSSETPLVLVFEDVHWVDPSTLDLMSALARRRERAKLMLVCTYRPVDVILSNSSLKALKQDLQVHNLCTEIALERLPEPDVAEYISKEFLDANLPSEIAPFIYRHSEGNPLFMVAIVQDMIKKGSIVHDDGEWRLTAPIETIDPGVPQSLQQMLEVQFESLTPAEQRALEAASVVGEHFSAWMIALVLDERPDQIEDLCDELVARQQIVKAMGIQELPNGRAASHYKFGHWLYRQAIYRRVASGKRARLHRTIAERLKAFGRPGRRQLASEIAFHFESGGEFENATRFLIVAAENAAAKFAYRDSIQILEHALRLVHRAASDGIHLMIQILGRIGDAHYALGNMLDSARAYEDQAVRAEQAGLKSVQVNALSCLARTTVLIDGEKGIAVSERAVQACDKLDDPLLAARTQMLAATLRLGYDEWRKKDAEICASARQTILSLTGPDRPSYQEIWDAHLMSFQGQSREAVQVCEAGMAKYYEASDADRRVLQGEDPGAMKTSDGETDQSTTLAGYVLALSAKSIAHLYLGEFGSALDVLRTARAQAEKNGSNPWLFTLREAALQMTIFNFADARELCAKLVEINPGYLCKHPKAIRLITEGYAAFYAKKYADASKCFREVRDHVPAQKFFLHWLWRMQAELELSNVLLEAGEIRNAQHEADRFLKSALSTSNPYLQALAWSTKAMVAMAQREWDVAEDHLSRALDIVNTFEVPLAAWRVHQVASEFYRLTKEPEKAEQHLGKAVSLILAMARSLDGHPSLRDTFLTAEPVRKVLDSKALYCQGSIHVAADKAKLSQT